MQLRGGCPDWCLNLILDVECGTFWNVVFQTPVIRGAFLYSDHCERMSESV
jgi:hypothetical protein